MITNVESNKAFSSTRTTRGKLSAMSPSWRNPSKRAVFAEPDGRSGENGMYYRIIGHRRLAADKQAGLTEVPCAV